MSTSNKDSSQEGWARFAAAHAIGDVLDGTVVSVVPFAAFVEIGDAVHGLLLEATLTVGEGGRVRVGDIDADKHRVRLSQL
jgi:ribosomal protein S1